MGEFLERGVEFKREQAEDIVQYSIADLDLALDSLVSQSLDLPKLRSRLLHHTSLAPCSPFLSRAPQSYSLTHVLSHVHSQSVTALALLQNGNLASGSLDSTLKIWDLPTQRVKAVFEGHTHEVRKIVELSTGNLASCSADNTVNIWDRHTGDIMNTLEGFDTLIKDIVELDQEHVLILNDNDTGFTRWNYSKELEDNCKTYEEHEDAVNKIIAVNRKHIFSASNDNTVKRWHCKNNEESEMTYQGHTGAVTDVVCLDHKEIASASTDKTIRIWEISTRWCAHTLEGHTRPITSLCYVALYQRLVSGSLD